MQKKLFSFQVPVQLKDHFADLCRQNDTSASREIREFMRRYIREKEKSAAEITWAEKAWELPGLLD